MEEVVEGFCLEAGVTRLERLRKDLCAIKDGYYRVLT